MRDRERLLSLGGLVALAIVAVLLSMAALLHTRPTDVEAVPATTPAASGTPSPAPETSNSPSPASEASESPAESPTPTESEAPSDTGTVVVIGDRHSRAELDDVWVDRAAEELGWGEVVNLSDPGRGYQALPGSCEAVDACSNFSGTIDAIVDADPDLVITFGGTADGDYDMTDQITSYYTALREALPGAELVGVSPVTSADEAEYWLTMHARNIENAVTSVGGTFVGVGQPGVGDGDELSPDAQDEVASAIIDALS